MITTGNREIMRCLTRATSGAIIGIRHVFVDATAQDGVVTQRVGASEVPHGA
jgi:hypothetical protein